MVKVQTISLCHRDLSVLPSLRPVFLSRKISLLWEMRTKPSCAHTEGMCAFGFAHLLPSVSSLVSFALSICTPGRHALFLSLPFLGDDLTSL